MTTRLALLLMALIVGFFILDHYVLQLNAFIFLSKKGLELIATLAFWR